MELVARTGRPVRDLLLETAVHQVDSAAKPPTSVTRDVRVVLEIAVPPLEASLLMDLAVRTERHAQARHLAIAAPLVASVARPATSVEQGVNPDPAFARQQVISRLTELAARTARFAKVLLLEIVARQVVSVARLPLSAIQDANPHMEHVMLCPQASLLTECAELRIARRVLVPHLETVVLAPAPVEVLRIIAAKDGKLSSTLFSSSSSSPNLIPLCPFIWQGSTLESYRVLV